MSAGRIRFVMTLGSARKSPTTGGLSCNTWCKMDGLLSRTLLPETNVSFDYVFFIILIDVWVRIHYLIDYSRKGAPPTLTTLSPQSPSPGSDINFIKYQGPIYKYRWALELLLWDLSHRPFLNWVIKLTEFY